MLKASWVFIIAEITPGVISVILILIISYFFQSTLFNLGTGASRWACRCLCGSRPKESWVHSWIPPRLRCYRTPLVPVLYTGGHSSDRASNLRYPSIRATQCWGSMTFDLVPVLYTGGHGIWITEVSYSERASTCRYPSIPVTHCWGPWHFGADPTPFVSDYKNKKMYIFFHTVEPS